MTLDKDESISAVLARIDERTKNMQRKMDSFVTAERFLPVERLVYGGTALALTAVASAMIYSVLT